MIENKRRNILLVHLFSNGDCLYATAIARQIKLDFPNCKLTWAIAPFCKSIINLNPDIDEVIEVREVKKNDVAAFNRYQAKIYNEKKAGVWDEVFVTQNMGNNLSLYDGTIRGMIIRAYPKPVIVSLQPELVLSDEEKLRVEQFAINHNLASFKNVILWEYAPQSGQSVLNFPFVKDLANKITSIESTCVILTSANKFEGSKKIIDASVLSVRENAALTHFCNLLIGCSSGITWLSTSTAAKFLPMLQLLNNDAYFLNAPSVDFKRYKVQHNGLIELTNFSETLVFKVVSSIYAEGMDIAKTKFNQPLKLQFNTTRKIVYNLLVQLQIKSIRNHYCIMIKQYGKNKKFLTQFWQGIIFSPFTFLKNVWNKKIIPVKK